MEVSALRSRVVVIAFSILIMSVFYFFPKSFTGFAVYSLDENVVSGEALVYPNGTSGWNDTGDFIKTYLADSDYEIIGETVETLLHQEQIGMSIQWKNPENGNKGKFSLAQQTTQNGHPCKEIYGEVVLRKRKKYVGKVIVCMLPDGTWVEIKKEIS